MIDQLPIFGICGPRGSGKTTLIEQMLPPLGRSGLKIAVVKHGARGVGVDRAGKDSDRLFQAGADVLLQGPRQGFFRARRADDEHWTRMILSLAGEYDLVLVEGHKGAPFRKVWLLGDRQAGPPADVTNVAAVLPRDSDRLAAALPIVARCVAEQWMKTPVFGCVLIGGNSARMGSPKHLLRRGATTWLEQTAQLLEHVCRSVIFSGAGGVPDSLAAHPRLADVPDAGGPMSGILAAMRWAPHVSWLVAACDLPDLSDQALRWLISTRAPGVWATLPRLAGRRGVEPLLAHYDFRSRVLLERLAGGGNFRLNDVASDPKVACPPVPSHLAPAWRNVNSPADLGPPAP